MVKIGRDAFLYLAPKEGDNKENFAQCGECRLWIGKKERCQILPADLEVKADYSCALFIPHRTLTPEEVGFVRRRVQCHRCERASPDVSHCELFESLGIDPAIKPNACCNAQEPKAERAVHKPHSGRRSIDAALHAARKR